MQLRVVPPSLHSETRQGFVLRLRDSCLCRCLPGKGRDAARAVPRHRASAELIPEPHQLFLGSRLLLRTPTGTLTAYLFRWGAPWLRPHPALAGRRSGGFDLDRLRGGRIGREGFDWLGFDSTVG